MRSDLIEDEQIWRWIKLTGDYYANQVGFAIGSQSSNCGWLGRE